MEKINSDHIEPQWEELQLNYPYKLLKKLSEGTHGVLY